MKRTTQKTSQPTEESSTSQSDSEREFIESADEVPVEEESPPQPLNPRPERGYIDRMLRPQKGMSRQGMWGGKPMFVCPRCKAQAFNKSDADKHRC